MGAGFIAELLVKGYILEGTIAVTRLLIMERKLRPFLHRGEKFVISKLLKEGIGEKRMVLYRKHDRMGTKHLKCALLPYRKSRFIFNYISNTRVQHSNEYKKTIASVAPGYPYLVCTSAQQSWLYDDVLYNMLQYNSVQYVLVLYLVIFNCAVCEKPKNVRHVPILPPGTCTRVLEYEYQSFDLMVLIYVSVLCEINR